MKAKLKPSSLLEIVFDKAVSLIFLTGFIFCLLLMALADSFAYAENVSLKDIFASPEEFDRQEVQIEGEAVGEPLSDAGGAWLNVSAGPQQIGIFSLDKEKVEEITYWGSYGATGDRVRVKGVFYKECPDHQISDLHLKSLEIVRIGYKNKHPISPQKRQLAEIFSIICLAIVFIYLAKLKYGKRD